MSAKCHLYCMDMSKSLRGSRQEWCRFTAWLGSNASTGKQRRLLGELHMCMTASGAVSTGRLGLRTSYLPTLRTALVQPLACADKDGIPAVLELLQVASPQQGLRVYRNVEFTTVQSNMQQMSPAGILLKQGRDGFHS